MIVSDCAQKIILAKTVQRGTSKTKWHRKFEIIKRNYNKKAIPKKLAESNV